MSKDRKYPVMKRVNWLRIAFAVVAAALAAVLIWPSLAQSIHLLPSLVFVDRTPVDDRPDHPICAGSVRPECTPPSTAPPSAPASQESLPILGTIPGTGEWKVDEVYVKSGTYVTEGPAYGDSCYWFTMSGNSKLDSSIVTGPAYASIAGSATYFQTSGCKSWTPVS